MKILILILFIYFFFINIQLSKYIMTEIEI